MNVVDPDGRTGRAAGHFDRPDPLEELGGPWFVAGNKVFVQGVGFFPQWRCFENVGRSGWAMEVIVMAALKERNAWNSDEEEFDEFGRKKRRGTG